MRNRAGIWKGVPGSLGIPAWEFPGLLQMRPLGTDIVGIKPSKETGKFEGEKADLMYKGAQLGPRGEGRGPSGNSGVLDGNEPGNCGAGVDFQG